MPVFLFIVFAILFLLLVSGGYIFLIGCYAGKKIDWLDEEVVKKTPHGEFFEYMRQSDKWLRQHGAQDVYITSGDGLRLHGLWVRADEPKGTVLMAHGYRSTMLLDFHLPFELFHRLGLNILVPEQRTHGQSQGRYITFGVKESDDMAAWLEYYNRELGRDPVILYGISMGASTMLYLANRDLPGKVCGIIGDCGFTSPAQIVSHVYRRVIRLWPLPSMLFAQLYTKLIAGFGLWEKDTRKSLHQSKYPILLIHGVEDGFVPCYMSKQAYENCNDPKQILLVEKADHGFSFLVDPAGYTGAVIGFLREYLPGFYEK